MNEKVKTPNYNIKELAQRLIDQGDIVPDGMILENVEQRIIALIPYAKKYWFYNKPDEFYGFLELGFFPREIVTEPYFAEIFDNCFNSEAASREEVLNFLHYEVVPKIKRKIKGEPLESPDYR